MGLVTIHFEGLHLIYTYKQINNLINVLFCKYICTQLRSFFVDKCSLYLGCLWKSSDIFGGKKDYCIYSSIAISQEQNSFYRIACQDRISTAYTAIGTQYAFK